MRVSPKRTVYILGAFTAVSFVFSLWGTRTFPIMAFYLLPSRAWELGAGATLVAWEIIHKKNDDKKWANERAQDFLGPAGLALLAIAVFGFDASTPFPGYLALLPVIGTVALLASEESAVNRYLLSAKPMVFVGAISYSWYLWHWPMMSYARIIAVGDPAPSLMMGVAGAAFCAAIFSWRLVERQLPTPLPRAAISESMARWTVVICST